MAKLEKPSLNIEKAKLRTEQLSDIVKMIHEGCTKSSIADKYNISLSMVFEIQRANNH